MGLTNFSYRERDFYDANDNLVQRQVEDRGNTSNVDGNVPAPDRPANAPNPDPVGGPAFVDTVYTYDILTFGGQRFTRLCEQARRKGLVCAPSVGPGYDARRAVADTRTKSRRDGATYDAMWSAALAAGADAVTITSYNEWHEGSQIEPARRRPGGYADYEGAWGKRGAAAERAYLDRTALWVRRYGP